MTKSHGTLGLVSQYWIKATLILNTFFHCFYIIFKLLEKLSCRFSFYLIIIKFAKNKILAYFKISLIVWDKMRFTLEHPQELSAGVEGSQPPQEVPSTLSLLVKLYDLHLLITNQKWSWSGYPFLSQWPAKSLTTHLYPFSSSFVIHPTIAVSSVYFWMWHSSELYQKSAVYRVKRCRFPCPDATWLGVAGGILHNDFSLVGKLKCTFSISALWASGVTGVQTASFTLLWLWFEWFCAWTCKVFPVDLLIH